MSNTTDQLIAGAEVALEAAKKRREKAIAEARAVMTEAQKEGRPLNDDDRETIDQCDQRMERAKGDIAAAEEQLERARALQVEENLVDQKYSEVRSTPSRDVQPKYDQAARVGDEERTYHRGNDPHGTQFLKDVVRSFAQRDANAEYRLARHMREEQVERAQYFERAVGTAQFTGLTVPQYLTDMYAPATAALRPFANICNQHPLPADGMSLNISRITTASGVALQSAEGGTVQNTDMDDTLLTVNVLTNAGQQTISRQAIDRGTGIEDVVFQDLFNRYHTNLDNTLLNQATTGLSAVATAVTYTDATVPTGEELYPKIVQATAGVETNLLGLGQPSHAVMHPRRWYWLQSQLTEKFPLISQPGITLPASGANSTAGYGNGSRGVLPNGMQVIVDANVTTDSEDDDSNWDEIYVVPAAECHLWEDADAPLFIRAEQPHAHALQVLLVVYGYFAYTFSRYPTAMQKVTGSGLVTPAF